MFQQNPEFLAYGVGGLIVGLFMLRTLKKRSKAREKNIALVMPQPYMGDADHALTDETAPASFDKDALGEALDEPIKAASNVVPSRPSSPAKPARPTRAKAPAERSLAEQLEDVSAINFIPATALTPNEARARVMIQAALNEFGAGYSIMARTALSAILQPASTAVGSERANALRALQGKYLDFGVFDRAGRCLVAIEITTDEAPVGSKALERAITNAAITQANLPLTQLSTSDAPADIYAKLAPYLKATARKASAPIASNGVATAVTKVMKTPRPGRPERISVPNRLPAE